MNQKMIDMNFNEKNVVITGGSTGIGLATAKAFIQAGANVLITGRTPENLKSAAAEINSSKLQTLLSDTSRLTGINALEKTVAVSGRQIDVLFLNAAIAQFNSIEHTTEESFDDHFNINVKGYFFTLQKLIPHLASGASVLLTSSIMGTGSASYSSVYSATKSAVSTIGRIAAVELADKNIRVNIVSPGPINTPGLLKAAGGNLEYVSAATVLKRIGNPDDVAAAVLFLASDAASNITGTELVVDAGMALRK